MKKRGVMEVQMHWIFVMIAGAIILSFFIGIVAKQRSIARKELIFDIENDLNLLLTGAKVTEGSITTIDIPDIEISFSCRDYWIEGQKKSLDAKPVFANDKIKGSQVLLMTLGWKMPFSVDNFVYATSPQIRFLFYNVPPSIYDDIPEQVTKEQVSDISNLEDNENYRLKFILFNQDPTGLSFPDWLSKYEAAAVVVYRAEDKIEYYEYINGIWIKQGTTHYLGTESLIGSFFTDNIDDFNCIMDKAVWQLNAIAKIYEDRTKQLDASNVCPLFYGDDNVERFVRLAEETSPDKRFSTGTIRVNEIENIADSLRMLNTDIEYQSCPVLY